MSTVLERIRREARLKPRRLVLAEGDDSRIVRAADRLSRDRLAEVTLIADRDVARATARKAEAALLGVRLEDAGDAAAIDATRVALRAARGERLTPADADRYARDPVFQAAARVRDGRADCFVAGASRTTADVLRAALWLIGTAPGVSLVSSFFLMVVPGASERVFVFADCGVVPDPNPAQLAEIGCLAADSFERLTGDVPHTAFLSFSTRGSAEHPRVARVREALALARVRRPDRHFDGELQLDAAVDPAVARKKAPDSAVAGHANVLIFPDLDAGNIGYKLVQRLGGAQAFGPILMGLARQANDLSRGCSAEDVVEVATIACALSAANRAPAGTGAAPGARS
ncbi:MAG: phosphotransacetylase [Candidatus Eisenbacteria bacterium]|nr:phosphotransacetylase [Candidatus Eisenbacteria bacterium]